MSVQIDLSRDALFDELGLQRLRESYMREGETSPQERYAFVAESFASNPEHAQRIYDYASRHWLSFSTPVLSFGRNKRGLPVSCFLSYMPDTAEGLVNTLSEVNWLSMLGGGVGIHVGIRNADDKSVGVMPHLRSTMRPVLRIVKVRRGAGPTRPSCRLIILTSFSSLRCASPRATPICAHSICIMASIFPTPSWRRSKRVCVMPTMTIRGSSNTRPPVKWLKR